MSDRISVGLRAEESQRLVAEAKYILAEAFEDDPRWDVDKIISEAYDRLEKAENLLAGK